VISCNEDDKTRFDFGSLVPSSFPLPIQNVDSIPSEAQFILGKKLFYDPILSRDNSISCASCHNPSLAFADTTAISKGIMGRVGERNSPSLGNVVYQRRLLREGGLPTLEMQVLVPIQEHAEFDHDIIEIANKLKQIPQYVQLSNQAYGQEPNPYVITRAISAFERSLFTGQSKYDLYLKNKATLTQQEALGLSLFLSKKTNCSSCHNGFLFTHQQLENNGIYEVYKDKGAMRLTQKTSDEGKFKTPSLRNIAITYPYMHDGSIKTLTDVINHYDSGGSNHVNKNPLIKPMNLTEDEKMAIVAFLHTLTDHNFLNNKLYHNE
jgi:cytochrome c peroxidase